MKRFILIFSLVLMFGCDSDKALDCIQAAGDIVQTEISVAPFSEIIVFERTQLFIQQGDEQKVVVESGENLLNDIELKVTSNTLSIKNKNSCNLVRDYGLTKVYITSPNISEIRSSTGLSIESIGVLRFQELRLISEDQYNEDEYHTDGDFIMNLEVDKLQVIANGLSHFFLSGSATNAFFGLYSGDCKIEAASLLVQKLDLYHRSTNDMVVNPQQYIKGEIVSLGNVISKNRPPTVEVEEMYRGELIFE